jgi:phosphate transport system permease protein
MSTDVVPQPGPTHLTPEERRAFVQASAARSHGRKVMASHAFMTAVGVALVAAFIPLCGIIYIVVKNARPYMSWSFLTTGQQFPDVFHPDRIGGISNAIAGTVECVGLALAAAIPLGILAAIALYEATNRIVRTLRIVLEVMVGMPSILFGLFVLFAVVRAMGQQFSLFAGSVALTVLMVPLIAVSCEDALRSVPASLPEAALALGARRSKVMGRVVLPYARPRILTGLLLSLSRAVGETAPVVFVIGTALATNWNPFAEATTLPSLIWTSQQADYPAQNNEVWGIALLLMASVLIINIASRVIVARTNRGQN